MLRYPTRIIHLRGNAGALTRGIRRPVCQRLSPGTYSERVSLAFLCNRVKFFTHIQSCRPRSKECFSDWIPLYVAFLCDTSNEFYEDLFRRHGAYGFIKESDQCGILRTAGIILFE